jgi:signal transduction histidine kinase
LRRENRFRYTMTHIRTSLVCAALLCCAVGRVHASCFSEMLGGDAPFDEQISRDPKSAIALIKAELSKTAVGSVGGASSAHLYAMLMDAYENAGDMAAAQDAAARGMAALSTTDGKGLQRRLQLTGIMMTALQGQIQRATVQYEQASAGVGDDAPDLVCVLGDRGYLHYLVDRKLDATVETLRAYRLAKGYHRDGIRLMAGQLLARLYSQYGLYDEALALANEGVAFYAHSPQKDLLSDAYLFRGDIFLDKGDYADAQTDFANSRMLLESIGDRHAQSYTQERLCLVAARMNQRADAPVICRDAYELAVAVKNPISAKSVLTALGRIQLASGHAREAIDLWSRALAEDGIDLPQHTRSEVYILRARARAQLGDTAGALFDTNLYVKSLEDQGKVRSTDQVAMLKVVFDTELKDKELARVHAEARAAGLESSRQASIRNQVAAAAIIIIATIPVVMWLWHRRKLAAKAHEAATEQMAAIGRLTGGIAHDFNNLLSVLQQAIGLVANRDSVTADRTAVDLLRQARRATEICAEITSQLLSFARQQNLKPEAVEIEGFLADTLPLLKGVAGTAVQLKAEIQQPGLVAWIDRRQLTTAILNLGANARDSMSNGGTLTLRASRAGDKRIRLDVIDEGCGMPPDVLARSIEPFYSTKPFGQGSGLGLSMVQGFATQSGGSLTIASEPNRGTTASLWLPIPVAAHE